MIDFLYGAIAGIRTGQDRGRFETTEKVVFLCHYSHVVTVKLYELE